MQTYTAQEASSILDLSKDTLRAYSLLLESKGYQIQRNPNKQRKYSQHDLDIINAMITLNKKGGLTLEKAAEKVSSSDFNASNVIQSNRERENQTSNANELQALPVAELSELHSALEFMAEHVATLERENERLVKHVEELEAKQDKALQLLEESNTKKEVAFLMEQIRELNLKIDEMDQQKNKGFFARLFNK